MTAASPKGILLGKLSRQTLINAQKQVFIDQPGGNLLYAAGGAAVWGFHPGLVSRVGLDYPGQWVRDLAALGFDTSGIRVLAEPADLRHFLAYRSIDQPLYENPIRHFADLGLPVPKSLLGYQPPNPKLDSRKSRTPLTLRIEDLPADFTGARAAHFCPLDYISHSVMPPALRELGIQQISVAASSSYMHPNFWNDIPGLVNGLSAFIATEEQIRTLFSGRSHDLGEMAKWLTSHNCGCVVVQRGERGHILVDNHGAIHYQIPAYPARPKDITGEEDAFGGGFLAALQAGADALQAALQGVISASLAVEGSGPFYVLDSSVGLAQSRLRALAEGVQVV